MTHFDVHDNYTWLLHLSHSGNVSCRAQLSGFLGTTCHRQFTKWQKAEIKASSVCFKNSRMFLYWEKTADCSVSAGICWSQAAAGWEEASLTHGGSCWTITWLFTASFSGITSEPLMDPKPTFPSCWKPWREIGATSGGTRKDQCFLIVQKRFIKM